MKDDPRLDRNRIVPFVNHIKHKAITSNFPLVSVVGFYLVGYKLAQPFVRGGNVLDPIGGAGTLNPCDLYQPLENIRSGGSIQSLLPAMLAYRAKCRDNFGNHECGKSFFIIELAHEYLSHLLYIFAILHDLAKIPQGVARIRGKGTSLGALHFISTP